MWILIAYFGKSIYRLIYFDYVCWPLHKADATLIYKWNFQIWFVCCIEVLITVCIASILREVKSVTNRRNFLLISTTNNGVHKYIPYMNNKAAPFRLRRALNCLKIYLSQKAYMLFLEFRRSFKLSCGNCPTFRTQRPCKSIQYLFTIQVYGCVSGILAYIHKYTHPYMQI